MQSVCLRLIVEREMEIEVFKAQEYWTVKAVFRTPRGQEFEAGLVTFGGKKLQKFDIPTATAAEMAVQAATSRTFTVSSVESKPATRNPWPPFMTSTLQQEASRKYGMGAKQCMNAAQRLYEAGHITYMRTDGIDMAPEAVMATRAEIERRFGKTYVPDSPRMYKNKAKNAQEAHECIRPTDTGLGPDKIRVEDDQRKLYDLIWKRTIASQMAAARMERTAVDVVSADGEVAFRANGQVVLFDGYLKVYDQGRDDEDDEEGRLPQVMQGEKVEAAKGALEASFRKAAALPSDDVVEAFAEKSLRKTSAAVLGADGSVLASQSFTQPPPRYTEATLVKRMEELGIGRPSTYASILTTIVDREYVRKDKNRLFPEDKGRLVTAFLSNFFKRYVEYDFTADLETELDDVSAGERDYKDVLTRFWRDFSAAVAETADLRIGEVLGKIDDFLSPHLYPPRADGGDPRGCPTCGSGRLHLKTARSGGAFIGCGNYPECRYTRPLAGDAESVASDGRILGQDENGIEISLRAGRFGPYVQRGEASEAQPKPDRASLPKGASPDTLTLDRALALLSLPREIGPHPETGEMVEAGIGRFGPFVKHGATYANITDVEEVFTIGMNRAIEMLAQKAARGGRTSAPAGPLKVLGAHPDGGEVQVMPGRYGPYVKWEKVNATLPKGVEPEAVTLEEALVLIADKAGKGGGKKKAPARKAAGPAAKKAPVKKTLAKKTAATRKAAKPAATGAKPAGGTKSDSKTAPEFNP